MKTSCTFVVICSLLFLSEGQSSIAPANCVLQKNPLESSSGNQVVCAPNIDQDYPSSEKKEGSSSEEKDGDMLLFYDNQGELPNDGGLRDDLEGYSDDFSRSNRAPEHQFMRFGRDHKFLRFRRDTKPNFMRFGRSASNGAGHQFLRFGRPDEFGMHKFMRFGKDGNVGGHKFMRFGRSGAEEDGSYENSLYPELLDASGEEFSPQVDDYLQRVLRATVMNHKFLRFGRANPSHNFMRFGRATGRNFVRFGRMPEHKFMRFGRSGWTSKTSDADGAVINDDKVNPDSDMKDRQEHMSMHFGRK